MVSSKIENKVLNFIIDISKKNYTMPLSKEVAINTQLFIPAWLQKEIKSLQF